LIADPLQPARPVKSPEYNSGLNYKVMFFKSGQRTIGAKIVSLDRGAEDLPRILLRCIRGYTGLRFLAKCLSIRTSLESDLLLFWNRQELKVTLLESLF